MVYCYVIIDINVAIIKTKLKNKNMQKETEHIKEAIFYFIAMLFIYLPMP